MEARNARCMQHAAKRLVDHVILKNTYYKMFTTLFQVGGAVTVLGQHFVNLKCMLPSYTEAEVYRSAGFLIT